jgi:hypothetical protein
MANLKNLAWLRDLHFVCSHKHGEHMFQREEKQINRANPSRNKEQQVAPNDQ